MDFNFGCFKGKKEKERKKKKRKQTIISKKREIKLSCNCDNKPS